MCPHDYDTVLIMFYSFCFNKVPSKTFRIAYGDSCVDPAENQKLLLLVISFENSQKRDFDIILFALNWYKNFSGFPNLSGVWNYISIRELHITTDCSVSDRFCFLCVVCLF